MKNLTDEELVQIYDLQEKYAEKIVDFARHGDKNEVLQFLQIIPELHSYEKFEDADQKIYSKSEFELKHIGEKIPQGRFIYKDLFSKWKGADSLREIFDEKYLWEFAEAQPTDLALFANNKKVALEKYSAEKYEKLREEIPKKLLDKIKNFMMNYAPEIREKAMRTAVYGYTNTILSSKLQNYSNEHVSEFEKITYLTRGEKADTIVGAYDLQSGLKIYHSELKNEDVPLAIELYKNDDTVFKIVYGEKSAELLSRADEKVLKLASRYNFVDTEEKLSILENHKICMFGTAEQKLKMYYKGYFADVSCQDYEKLLENAAEKFEREGFSRKYYPGSMRHKSYEGQSFKVVSRCKVKIEDYYEPQPYWNIVFEDGKIISAKADEIISSVINERFYGEQVENFGKRPLEKVLVNDEGKMGLYEGEEKISAIIHQLQKNGESVEKIKDFLEMERKNLSKAR